MYWPEEDVAVRAPAPSCVTVPLKFSLKDIAPVGVAPFAPESTTVNRTGCPAITMVCVAFRVSETEVVDTGFTIRVVDCDVLLYEAVTFTVVTAPTEPETTGTDDPLDCPEGIVMLGGAGNAAELLDVKLICAPLAGAGPLRIAVIVAELPPGTEFGVVDNADKDGNDDSTSTFVMGGDVSEGM
jgi:hypothetical protein